MRGSTHGNGDLVAKLAAQGPRLSKSQMVDVGRRSTADQSQFLSYLFRFCTSI